MPKRRINDHGRWRKGVLVPVDSQGFRDEITRNPSSKFDSLNRPSGRFLKMQRKKKEKK